MAAAFRPEDVGLSGDRTRQGLIQLRMVQALDTSGVDAMVARYHELKAEHPSATFAPLMPDPLGWRLFRGDRQAPGLAVFELNYAEHPDAFVSSESLAWAHQLSGDHDRGIEIAQRWANANPDHEAGQDLLAELQRAAEN